jgi:hypothetical protein
MSRRPATAGAVRRSNPPPSSLSSSGSKSSFNLKNLNSKNRPQTAKGRWGYGVGSEKAKVANRNKLGRGVSAPSTNIQDNRRRRRHQRPFSAYNNPSNTLMPEFDPEYMNNKNNNRERRKTPPSYTIKYLGISKGEIGILSRKVRMSSGTRSRPRSKINMNIPTMYRRPKYRLDPDVVTHSLRELHMKRNNKRPSTAPQVRDELDNGVTPCPDLYDSWKIPFTKQPTLLSSGGYLSSAFNQGYHQQQHSTNYSLPQQHQQDFSNNLNEKRPTTATGMRRRRQKEGKEEGAARGEGEKSNSNGRPSTAPPNSRRL